MKKLITLLICLTVMMGIANAATYYVNTGLATGANNGSSWTDAYRTFSAAAAAASTTTGVDNVYVKGSISVTGTWNMSTDDNYYGSFDPSSSNSDPALRPMNDNDGNGIVEPWEFEFPTIFTSTAATGNAITGSTGILDGFTITHTPATVTGTTAMATLSSPIGQTIQNCVFTGSILTYGTASDYSGNNKGCLLKVLGTFQNNLIEKNTVSISTALNIQISPLLDIELPASVTVDVKVKGCIFRNNSTSIYNSNATSGNNCRGMILNVTHVTNANASATFSNCIIQNNNASYTYLTKPNTANGIAGSMSGSNNSSTDSYINCLFANNKMTNLYACFFPVSQGSVSTVIHKMYNCVFWNNQNTVPATAKTVTMYSNGTQHASAAFDNNYLDADKSGTWTGWGANNQINLSKTNTTATTGPQFIRPPLNGATNTIGASASFTSGADLTAISQSDWRMLSTSYLYRKGMATSTTGVTTDKAGLSFFASSPTVGPYEYALIPIISWTQDLTTLATGATPVALTAASTVTPASSPAGTVITYTSGNESVVTVSGSTMTIVGVGTTTVTAHQAANVDYPAAADVSQTVTVRLPQTITYTPLSNKEYGSAPFTLNATSTSGGPLTFASSKTYVATVSGNTATIVGVGSACYFTITQAGDATYAPVISSGKMGFSVTPKPLTITAPTIAPKVYDGSTTSGTVTPGTLSGFVGTETVTVSAATGTYADANVGTGKTATIAYTLANGTNSGLATNYSLANGSATGDITAASGTPTGSDLTNSGLTDNQLANTNLTVSSGEFIINDTKTVRSLTIAPGAKLTHSSGSLTATNGIILESDATGTATLMDSYTEPTISATVKQYVTAGRNWYISAPLNNTADYSVLNKGTSVAEYNELTGLWPTVSSGTLTRGKGYVQVASSGQGTTGTVSFNGTTNSGNVPVTLTNTLAGGKGFNLVGNPYPSYLSWSAVAADNAAANMPTGTMWYRTISYNGKSAWAPTTAYNLNDIVYNGTRFYKVTTAGTSAASGGPTGSGTGITDGSVVWNYEGSIYLFATISASGVASPATVSNLVPPMQAFWVKSTGGTLTFKNAMRSHNTGGSNVLKVPKNSASDIKLLRLNVSNGVSADEAVIYASNDASNAFDTYDAPKYFNIVGSNQPEIYTQVGNEKLVINAMSEINQGTEIPLGFATEKGNDFTISASEYRNFGSDIKVLLKDKQTSTEFDLTSRQLYAFSSDVVNDINRFSVIFRTAGNTTGIGTTEKPNAQVFVNAANQITIIAPVKSNYAIYNAIGQKQYENSLTSTNTTTNKAFGAGVYFVAITVNGQREIQKIIIR